jgi:hypothetical protein
MTARRRKGERDDDPYVMDIGKLFGKRPAWAWMRAGPVAGVDGTTLAVLPLAFAWLSVLAR